VSASGFLNESDRCLFQDNQWTDHLEEADDCPEGEDDQLQCDVEDDVPLMKLQAVRISDDEKEEDVECCGESVSTTASSMIPADIVHDRVKKTLKKRTKGVLKGRRLAKGEASAVNRTRKDNEATVKECSSIWS